MSQFNKRMEKIFDVAPIEINDITLDDSLVKHPTAIPSLSSTLSHDLEIDYENVRDSINSLLQKGMTAVDDMLAIARQSEKARDFEVAGNLITQMVDNSERLIELQKQIRNISGEKASTKIQNAVFVGSTTELLKAMKSAGKEDGRSQ